MQVIRSRLDNVLHPLVLELDDESHLHAGHAGAREGRGHYRVRIVSPAFQDLRLMARHQLVYGALGDLMQTDIHALSITALAPGEPG
jgi:BolA protein